MKVLVTGATGFIGQAIIERLLAISSDDLEITAIARNSSDAIRGTDGKRLRFAGLDITNRAAVSAFADSVRCDAVVHAAGLAHQFGSIDAGLFEKLNVGGAENIAELAVNANAKHFVLIGSTAVYGVQNGPIDESSPCLPETPYAESKLKAEEVCRRICEANNLPLTIFRLAPVLGEKGVGNVPRLIRAIRRGRFVWLGNGENRKSLVHVGDVARACETVLKNKTGGTEIFNIAADAMSMKELVRVISTELQTTVPRFSIPASFPRGALSIASRITGIGSLKRLSITIDKWLCDDIYAAERIRESYGFRPEISIEEAVRMQCRWFLEKNT